MEQIIANTIGYTVPLLYPEAMLFPSLFWKGTLDNEIIGSIPRGLTKDENFYDHMVCGGCRPYEVPSEKHFDVVINRLSVNSIRF